MSWLHVSINACLILNLHFLGEVNTLESLFNDPSSMDRKRQAEDFSPIFFDNLNFTVEQVELCGGSESCLFDFAVTGDVEIATNILEHEKNTTKAEEILCNNYDYDMQIIYMLHVFQFPSQQTSHPAYQQMLCLGSVLVRGQCTPSQ